jgi:DNA-binding NarL/FixJ family response regulator
MIRVAVLDRHPAVRAGMGAILDSQPGMAMAGAAADPRELWSLIYRARPDVVLVDHDPGACNGLGVCMRLKSGVPTPRVVLWVADGGPDVVVPATLAHADALVDEAADERELLHAIRVVAAGGTLLPAVTPILQAHTAARLRPQDRAIFAMRLAGTAPADIATTVGVSRRDLLARAHAIVARLGAPGGGAPFPEGDAPDLPVRSAGAAA